jgi:hypothetical protein
MRKIRRLLLTGLLCVALPSASGAFTISADQDTGDCFSSVSDDCVGGEYTLEVQALGGSSYQATLSMNFSGDYDLDIPATHISHVELKVANQYLDPIMATSAPDAAANWPALAGPLNGDGCGGNNDGFICLDAVSDLEIGGATSLEWQVAFDTDSLLDESAWHIGARFVWTSINPQLRTIEKSSLLSAPAPGIPEPGAMSLFACGLLVVAGALRWRRG